MNIRTSHPARRAAARAFTMVELLVALAISSFIIVTVYFVMSTSSTTFRQQNDISIASDRLAYAMDTIKNDVRRASFLTSPNFNLGPDQYPWFGTVCAPPPWFASSTTGVVGNAVRLDPVAADERDDGLYVPARERDRIVPGQDPDRIILLGAFRAEEAFRPTFMQAGASTMRIANEDYLFTDLQYLFDDAFVAVTSPSGGTQFLRVTGVSAHATLPETVLTLGSELVADPSNGTNPACSFQGFGGGSFEVVPLHFVRYSIEEDANTPGDTLLVREELDGNLEDLTIVSRYVVARNIVDLQFWFDGVPQGSAGQLIVRDGDGSGTWSDTTGSMAETILLGDVDAQPENLRYAYVQMSARLSTTVARNVVDDAAQGLREWIELRASNGATPAYLNEFTRVITVRGEVELPNVTLAQSSTP